MLRHRAMLASVDRGSVPLMVYVYTAFSEATVDGLWHVLAPRSFAAVMAINASLLVLMLVTTAFLCAAACLFARRRNYDRGLRLEKEPGQRDPDGQCPVPVQRRGWSCCL
jgi:hypothetical protein